jgi:hypothetical protein
MLLSMKSFKIMVCKGDRIGDRCRGSLDGELPMPASSRSLRLAVIAPRASGSIARLILVVLTLCGAGASIAQAPPPQPRADQEPITPIPPPPVQDPRQVALGDRLFHDCGFRMTTPAAAILAMTHRQTARAPARTQCLAPS